VRRIAVGHQERLEAIAAKDGWLSEGHGLDLTLLATGPNFETRTNGATHMGNDDITIFDGLAHLRIIDCSCPQQLLSIMKWIMEGNRGLVYLRVMRAPSKVLFSADFSFEFGRAYTLRDSPNASAVIVSTSRGVHEALATAKLCAESGVEITVVDMPSIDEDLLLTLFDSGKLLCLAEQNNGYIWQNLLKTLYKHNRSADFSRVLTLNTLDRDQKPLFIHSGTYEELLDAFGLSAPQIARAIIDRLNSTRTSRLN
jgi:transketolase C-terminal domain/subunit